jgi:hypothetical protein
LDGLGSHLDGSTEESSTTLNLINCGHRKLLLYSWFWRGRPPKKPCRG